jgi:nucleotide-binding universal stress UspA family protein
VALFPTRVLLAADTSPSASQALAAAVQVCASTGSELYLGHVKTSSPSVVGTTPSGTQSERLAAEAEALLAGVRAEVERQGGTVADTAIEAAQDVPGGVLAIADRFAIGLIVVGGSGGGTVQRTVSGDVSGKIVRTASIPVLVVPG